MNLPPLGVFLAILAVAYALAPRQRGVEETRYHPRYIAAVTSSGVQLETTGAAYPLGPSEPPQRLGSVVTSALDLPRPKALAAVADRAEVAPRLMDADCDKLLSLGVTCVRRGDVSRDRGQLGQPRDVVRRRVKPPEQADQDMQIKGNIHRAQGTREATP